MGKTKGKHLRVAAEGLIKKFPEAFTGVFEEDQEAIRKMGVVTYSHAELNKLSAALSSMVKRANKKAAALAAKEAKPVIAAPAAA